jgi:hypothetical protein
MVSTINKRHTEFTMESTSKRLRFCLDHDDVPSLPFAIAALDLLGENADGVLRMMNERARRSIHRLTIHARSSLTIGTVVEKWHMLVVQWLLEKTSFVLEDRKEAFDRVGCCKDILDDTRTFLVEGHLNDRYTTNNPGQQHVVVYNMRDECTRDRSWRYVIALKGGMIYAPALSSKGISMRTMWLDEDGRPDQQKGFLKRILKVYEVRDRVIETANKVSDNVLNCVPIIELIQLLSTP